MAPGPPDCLIHFEGENRPLAVFTEVAYKIFLECSEIWKTLDGKQREIAEKTAHVGEKQWKNSAYYRVCCSKFTNKTLIKRATIIIEKQCLASQNNDLSVSDKNAPETRKNELKRKTRAFCQSKPMYYSVYYCYSVSLLDMVGLEPSKKY